LNNIRLYSFIAFFALFFASAASAGGYILLKAEELGNGAYRNLTLLPDGSVVHLARMQLRALFSVYAPGDTIVYDTENDSMLVLRDMSPSEVLQNDPLTSLLLGQGLLGDVDLVGEVAIFEESSDHFYTSLPGYTYTEEAVDGDFRIIFAGDVVVAYEEYQPPINPFQPDNDSDGVPDDADACSGSNYAVDSDGCTTIDECPCAGDWKNHGGYTSCVAQASNARLKAGLIGQAEKATLVSNAAQSSCGKLN
jgi:hypothetical protein